MKLHDPKCERWMTQAQAGDPEAQYQLGLELFADERYAEGVEWLRKSAEQGHADATARLGFSTMFGYGLPENRAEGLAMSQKALEMGSTYAYSCIGAYYEESDVERAMDYYTEGIVRGDARSKYNLGMLYAYGKGIPKDVYKGMSLLKDAAEAGFDYAYYALYYLCNFEQEGPVASQRLAVQYMLAGAEHGQWECMYATYIYYMPLENGQNSHADEQKYIYWLKKASDAGYPLAQIDLAMEYLAGDTLPENRAEAVQLLTLASKAVQANADGRKESLDEVLMQTGHDMALIQMMPQELVEYIITNQIGDVDKIQGYWLYTHGDEVKGLQQLKKSDSVEAKLITAGSLADEGNINGAIQQLWQAAWMDAKSGGTYYRNIIAQMVLMHYDLAQRDPSTAIRGIAEICEQYPNLDAEDEGEFCGMLDELNGKIGNQIEAIRWRKRSAELGNVVAQCNLGIAYYQGEYVPMDKKLGRQWIQRSADAGNEYAVDILKKIDANSNQEKYPPKSKRGGLLGWFLNL